MGRTLVIGDIHGGLKALVQVLHRATVTSDDNLVFLGDYVDGWSQSAQVIEYLITLSSKQPCIFLKGNHDAWCEDWLRTGIGERTWLWQGGQSTVDSYDLLPLSDRPAHLQFFEAMKTYFVDEENRLFIHAGFTSMHGPQHETHVSNFLWDRTLWETAVTMDKKMRRDSLLFPKRFKIFDEIYIGHTPTLYYNVTVPMKGCNVWNIDTGAAFKGKLSILDAATKKFWQSDPVHTLYPGEAGRNRD